jgi:hypothetical protein
MEAIQKFLKNKPNGSSYLNIRKGVIINGKQLAPKALKPEIKKLIEDNKIRKDNRGLFHLIKDIGLIDSEDEDDDYIDDDNYDEDEDKDENIKISVDKNKNKNKNKKEMTNEINLQDFISEKINNIDIKINDLLKLQETFTYTAEMIETFNTNYTEYTKLQEKYLDVYNNLDKIQNVDISDTMRYLDILQSKLNTLKEKCSIISPTVAEEKKIITESYINKLQSKKNDLIAFNNLFEYDISIDTFINEHISNDLINKSAINNNNFAK